MTRVAAVLVLACALAATGAFAAQSRKAPNLHLAVFPPVDTTGVAALRGIVLGGGTPVASTPIPNVWLVHLEPGQDRLPGAIVTGAGPLVALASAACLKEARP